MAHILAVDDDPDLCTLLKTALERDGHAVEIRTSGVTVTESLCRWADCILLDDDARAVADLAQFVENCKKPLFFVGDGASLCYNKYSNVPGVLTVPPELRGGRAAAVALVAKQMAQRGEAVLPEALLPDYHRLSQAERERAERLAAEAAARNNDTENGKD